MHMYVLYVCMCFWWSESETQVAPAIALRYSRVCSVIWLIPARASARAAHFSRLPFDLFIREREETFFREYIHGASLSPINSSRLTRLRTCARLFFANSRRVRSLARSWENGIFYFGTPGYYTSSNSRTCRRCGFMEIPVRRAYIYRCVCASRVHNEPDSAE